MVHVVARALLLLLALALAGCARGPAGTEVRDALQRQLDDALGGRVVAIESLQRAGSAPGRDGAARLVYYNASLKLALFGGAKPLSRPQYCAYTIAPHTRFGFAPDAMSAPMS